MNALNFIELMRKYCAGKGNDAMWRIAEIVSNYFDEAREEDPERIGILMHDVYESLCGPHYDKTFSEEQITGMHYEDDKGMLHYAPFWTTEEIVAGYNEVKDKLPESCTIGDLCVTMHLILSIYGKLFKEWFKERCDMRILDMAVAYLNDDGEEDGKIWRRFNAR